MQCWHATGYCWCVDETGTAIEGTTMRGRPDCNKGRGQRLIKSINQCCIFKLLVRGWLFFPVYFRRSSWSHAVCTQADAEDPQCRWWWVLLISFFFFGGGVTCLFSICWWLITCCVFLFSFHRVKRDEAWGVSSHLDIFADIRSHSKLDAEPRAEIVLILPPCIHLIFNILLAAWDDINHALLQFIASFTFSF